MEANCLLNAYSFLWMLECWIWAADMGRLVFSGVHRKHGIVTMADVNERALQLAIDNANLNRITNVRMVKSNLFDGLSGATFTHIVTNPPIRAGK